MSEHKKYNKIHGLGKEEVEGILEGEVQITEKIDGANASIWREDNHFQFGSRNHVVPNFRGIKEYVKKNIPIINLLNDNPHYRLFGEWLVKHTISYNELSYGKFYMFDILDDDTNEYISPQDTMNLGLKYGILMPQVFETGVFTEEEITKYVGESCLGTQGEGVVIKNPNYTNKFGIKPQYAKIVTQKFKEDNAITFGGNNKHSETYWEQKVCNEYITLNRVKKIVQKLESALDRPLELKDTPRVSSTAYHDMLEEEIWSIQKKTQSVNFKDLGRICNKKAIQIFKDLLSGDISITDSESL